MMTSTVLMIVISKMGGASVLVNTSAMSSEAHWASAVYHGRRLQYGLFWALYEARENVFYESALTVKVHANALDYECSRRANCVGYRRTDESDNLLLFLDKTGNQYPLTMLAKIDGTLTATFPLEAMPEGLMLRTLYLTVHFAKNTTVVVCYTNGNCSAALTGPSPHALFGLFAIATVRVTVVSDPQQGAFPVVLYPYIELGQRGTATDPAPIDTQAVYSMLGALCLCGLLLVLGYIYQRKHKASRHNNAPAYTEQPSL